MKILGMRFFEKQIIGAFSGVAPLLIRRVLFRVPRFGIYLHHLLRSDYDRALHDHPWPFISIVLRGGYWEIHDQTTDGRQVSEYHGRGSILIRPAEWRHRFTLAAPAWDAGRRWTPPAQLGILCQRRLVLVAAA